MPHSAASFPCTLHNFNNLNWSAAFAVTDPTTSVHCAGPLCVLRERSFMDSAFHVFTDGSAIGNPGPGGWAAVLIRGNKRWEISGACPSATISEMELLAAVEALRPIAAGALVQLCSDSELLIHGMRFYVWLIFYS